MLAILRGTSPDGTVLYTGMMQAREHQGIPVLVNAVYRGGRGRMGIANAIADAKHGAKTSKQTFPPVRGSIAVQSSQLPSRVVHSGLIRDGEHDGIPIFMRAAGSEFHWPEDISEAISAAESATPHDD